MGTYRETTLAGKAAQRGIVEQREQPQRGKKKRTVVVEFREIRKRRDGALLPSPSAWKRWGAYITTAGAQQMVERNARHAYYSHYYEFRIRPAGMAAQG